MENNLFALAYDLTKGYYRHGTYVHKIVNEKKRRDIHVAAVRDRIVHRLLYDYLVPIINPRLDPDVWSCRPGKGLHGAIKRTSLLSHRFSRGWVYRADVRRFFDNVDQAVLKQAISQNVHDTSAICLIDEVIGSYKTDRQTDRQAGRYAYW